MKNLRTLLALSISVVLLAACGGTTKTPPIPKNAAMVFDADFAALGDKSEMAKLIETTPFLGAMVTQMGLPDFLSDRAVTGINFAKDNYLAMVPTDEDPEFIGAIHLQDASKFKAMLLEAGGEDVKEEGDLLISNGMVVKISGKMAIIYGGNRGPEQLQAYLDLPESERITSNPSFKSFVADQGDFSMWANVDELSKLSKDDMPLALSGTVNANMTFNPGLINMTSTMTGAEMASSLHAKANVDLMAKLPAAKLLGFARMTMDMDVYGGMLHGIMGSMHDDHAELDMVTKAAATLSGDIVIGMTGMTEETMDLEIDHDDMEDIEDIMDLHGKSIPEFFVALGLTDAEAFKQLSMEVDGQTLTFEEMLAMHAEKGDFWHHISDDMVVISNNEAFMVALAAGETGLAVPAEATEMCTKYHNAAFANIPAILAEAPQDEEGAIMMLEMFDWAFAHAEVKDDKVITATNIHMANKDANSLKVMLETALKGAMQLAPMFM